MKIITTIELRPMELFICLQKNNKIPVHTELDSIEYTNEYWLVRYKDIKIRRKKISDEEIITVLQSITVLPAASSILKWSVTANQERVKFAYETTASVTMSTDELSISQRNYLKKNISTLQFFSVRTKNLLMEYGIATGEDLSKYSFLTITAINGIGRKGSKELIKFEKSAGIVLA